MLPELTRSWIDLVALQVDLALRRSRSEPVEDAQRRAAANAHEAVSRRTRTVAALVGVLAQRLGLSLEEELAAWTLVAGQLDPSIASRLEALSGRPEVTKGALVAVAYTEQPARAIHELGLEGNLMSFGLVEHADSATTSWARRSVRATERMLAVALLDADARPPASAFLRPTRTVPRCELALSDATAVSLEAAVRGDALVVLTGVPASGKRTALTAFARDAGLDVLEVDARGLADDVGAFTCELRAIVRECRLLARVPLLGNVDALASKPRHLALLASELAARVGGPIYATASGPMPRLAVDRPVVAVDMEPPTSARRARLWLAALGDGTERDGELLADRYPIAAGLIVRSANAAKARAHDRGLAPDDIAAGVRATLDDRLGQFARRVTVTQTWDDLVLPQEQVDTLEELLARVRERRRVYETGASRRRSERVSALPRCFRGRRARARRWPRPWSRATSGSSSTASTSRTLSRNGSVKRRSSWRRCSTPPSRGTRSCCSTRPTRCSGSAPT
jgi:hypothetical protein